MINRFLVAIFVCFLSTFALGQTINKITIQGTQRIEDETVISYLDITPGVNFSTEEIDRSIKRLYDSSLFKKVEIFVQDKTLLVKVIENPKINLVVFEGNTKIKSKELEDEISLKPRGIYTKARVQDDVNRIIELYAKKGRFSAKVVPQIIELENNRVNLVYKVEEGPVARISKIVFIGNKAYSDSTLRDEIQSREYRWYNFLTNDDQFNPIRIEQDRELLTRFYSSKGYADFKIVSIITNISENKKKFFVTFTVDEGPKFKFGEIDVISNLTSAKIDLKAMKSKITTKSKDIYDVRKVEKSVDQMIKEVNDLGYAFVDIDTQVELDYEKKLVNIRFVIGESRKVYINKINIKGNVRTADSVIRREFRLAEGDPYNNTKIKRSEKRINDLDYFEPTSIETTRTSSPDKVDLNVEVQEKSTSSIHFAGGYSTADGPVGKIGFNESNLFGKGKYLSVNIAKSTRAIDGDLSFTEPYLFDRPLAGGFDIYSSKMDKNESQYRRYDKKTLGGSLRMSYNISENLSHTVRYSIIDNDISNVSDNASSIIKQQQGRKINSMIGNSLTYDKRDKKVNPSDGYIISLDHDYAGLGGNTYFSRYGATAKKYFPIINEDVVLMLRGEYGYIHGLKGDNVDITDRYFMGGAESLRGFDFGGIGPRDSSNNDTLGGNVMYLGTSELRFPLGVGKDLGLFGAAFVDVGSLYKVDVADQTGIWDSKKMRASYGFGLGFVTPMGPIKIHYAIPVRKTNFDIAKKFDISFTTNF